MEMNENPAATLPELLLVLAAVVGLLAGSWLPRNRQWVVRLIAVAGCLAGVAAAAVDLARPAQEVFDGTYVVDVRLGAVRFIVLLAILLTIGNPGDQRFAYNVTQEDEPWPVPVMVVAGRMRRRGPICSARPGFCRPSTTFSSIACAGM